MVAHFNIINLALNKTPVISGPVDYSREGERLPPNTAKETTSQQLIRGNQRRRRLAGVGANRRLARLSKRPHKIAGTGARRLLLLQMGKDMGFSRGHI